MLQNENLVVKIGLNTAENEPSEVTQNSGFLHGKVTRHQLPTSSFVLPTYFVRGLSPQ